MNFMMVLILLVAVLGVVVQGSPLPQLITAKRRFPGERRLGATNYGQYSIGKRGFKKREREGDDFIQAFEDPSDTSGDLPEVDEESAEFLGLDDASPAAADFGRTGDARSEGVDGSTDDATITVDNQELVGDSVQSGDTTGGFTDIGGGSIGVDSEDPSDIAGGADTSLVEITDSA